MKTVEDNYDVETIPTWVKLRAVAQAVMPNVPVHKAAQSAVETVGDYLQPVMYHGYCPACDLLQKRERDVCLECGGKPEQMVAYLWRIDGRFVNV